jgi:chromatin segregation and condensation protein Rec8/ScpA/Scc1 (kleisin family)
LEAWTPALNLENTSLDSLISALREMLRDQLASDGSLAVAPHEVTIDDKIDRIGELIKRPQQLFFDDVLEDAKSKVEIIVTLLAVLELIRARRISVHQETLFGRILILPLKPETQPENTQGTAAELPTVDDAS